MWLLVGLKIRHHHGYAGCLATLEYKLHPHTEKRIRRMWYVCKSAMAVLMMRTII
jgi:hypothetical protein